MKFPLLIGLLGTIPFLALSEVDPTVAIITAILGGGGIIGVVKLWIASLEKRDERADVRLERIIVAAQAEREKDRTEERDERERGAARFDAALQRFESAGREQTQRTVVAMNSLTEEIRKLRADQRAGLACRYLGDVLTPQPSKPDGTRSG